MSKIGKKPIEIPAGVTVEVGDRKIKIRGSLGELELPNLEYIKVSKQDSSLIFETENDRKQARSNWGTMRSLAANAISGVISGFSKKLILEGIGFRVVKDGDSLNMSLGFSHPVRFSPPAGISFEVEKNSILTIKGINKELVGQTAAKIRAMKKPEPYKGKGFHYEGEVIRRKAGKKAATA